MGKDQRHWEPDARKGLDDFIKMDETKRKLEEDFARRKIDGFNPGDLVQDKKK